MPEFVSNTVQVHIAAFDEEAGEYKFLALKRSGNAKLYPNVWQVITGKIEEGESALNTALREIEEEINVEPLKMWTLPYVATFFMTKRDEIHAAPTFGAIVDYNKEISISGEHSAYEWLSFEDCLKRLFLPTHIEGTRIFSEFILKNKNSSVYLIDRFK